MVYLVNLYNFVQGSSLFILDYEEIEKKNLLARNAEVRVGVHSGSAMCGVVGGARWCYDVWGNDVVKARQVEKRGKVG